MGHYTYFVILALSLLGPLALSFDKKVAFYKQWKYVVAAMLLPALFFIIWDIVFTRLGVWSFNAEYITGFHIAAIPLEEALFFFVVPYCCTFIYECIRVYFPRLKNNAASRVILGTLAIGLFILAMLHRQQYYTFFTGIFTSLFITVVLMAGKRSPHFNATAFLTAYAVILLPFLAVNGVLTYLPVVLYNDAHNLSLRMVSIPVEDIFYGMLLVLMNIFIFEMLRNNRMVIMKK